MEVFKNLNYFPNNNLKGINFYLYGNIFPIQLKQLLSKMIQDNGGVRQ